MLFSHSSIRVVVVGVVVSLLLLLCAHTVHRGRVCSKALDTVVFPQSNSSDGERIRLLVVSLASESMVRGVLVSSSYEGIEAVERFCSSRERLAE